MDRIYEAISANDIPLLITLCETEEFNVGLRTLKRTSQRNPAESEPAQQNQNPNPITVPQVPADGNANTNPYVELEHGMWQQEGNVEVGMIGADGSVTGTQTYVDTTVDQYVGSIGGDEQAASVPAPSTSVPQQPQQQQQSTTPQNTDDDDINLYPILQLAHLIANDLPSARFAARRTPPQLRNDTYEAVTALGEKLWARDLPGVYTALSATSQPSSATSSSGLEWPGPLRPLLNALHTSLQSRTLALLSETYSSISVSQAATMLGLDARQPGAVVEWFRGVGWVFDEQGGWLSPGAGAVRVEGGEKVGGGGDVEVRTRMGLEEIGNLARMVVHLEDF